MPTPVPAAPITSSEGHAALAPLPDLGRPRSFEAMWQAGIKRRQTSGTILPITGGYVPDLAAKAEKERERQRRWSAMRTARNRAKRARGEAVTYYHARRATAPKRSVSKPNLMAVGWSAAQDDFLRTHWGIRPDRWVAHQLGKARHTCQNRAHVLRLTLRDNIPGLLWVTDAATLFGVSANTVNGWITQGWLRREKVGAVRIPGTGARAYPLSPDALRQFVETMPWAYDYRRMTPGHPLTEVAQGVGEREGWMRVDDAAALVHYCGSALHLWIADGLLRAEWRQPFGLHQGRRRFRVVREADVRALAAERPDQGLSRIRVMNKVRTGEAPPPADYRGPVLPPPPIPLATGDVVRCVEPPPERPYAKDREGTVKRVFYTWTWPGVSGNRPKGRMWRAEVEFVSKYPNRTRGVVYSLPVAGLQLVGAAA